METPSRRRRILYIEDDRGLSRLVEKDMARRTGDKVDTVETGLAGLSRLAVERYDAVALDHNLPDRDGIEILHDILQLPDPPPVVYVTGADDSRTAVAALKSGASEYVIKQPSNGAFFDLLASALQSAIDQAELRRAKIEVEQALHEKERRLSLAMDAGAFGDWLVSGDPAGGQAAVAITGSGRFWRHIGLQQPSGSLFLDECSRAIGGDAGARLTDALTLALEAPQNFFLELQVGTQGDQERWVELRGQSVADGEDSSAVSRVVGVSLDATGRKAAETARKRFTEILEQRVAEEMEAHRSTHAELVQAQKMEVVGQLTGGVAHDFNNLLTIIIGNLELVQMRSKSEADQKAVKGAMRAADRAAELTRQLLAFSRKQHLAVKAVDVNDLVRAMEDLLARSIGTLVRVKWVLDSRVSKALADPSQLELAILNLAINARDAMPLGGSLTISTANIDARHPERPETLSDAGDYIMIAVSDTGNGMSRDVKDHAFEPFFTTKEVGKGSGLGLSMVYGFVKQSGGVATIESELGKGTTIRLFLPCAAAIADSAAKREAGDGPMASLPSARILVVDDDSAVRALVADVLLAAGHDVVQLGSGQAALDLLSDPAAQPFDLLLADFAMPQMDGAELIARTRELHPEMVTMMMTGFADTQTLTDRGVTPTLQKPFKMHELAAALEQALAGRARPKTQGNVVALASAGTKWVR